MNEMTKWIWERDTWPNFDFDRSRLDRLLTKFDFNNQISLKNSILFENSSDDEFVVNIQGLEAIKTSEIEGEIYELPAIINSIRSGFNILADTSKEANSQSLLERRKSVSSMMVDLYRHYQKPLSAQTLHHWNSLLTHDESAITSYAGKYRDYAQDMEIGSGSPGSTPDYVAPPSAQVPQEMEKFIEWYNDTGPDSKNKLHPLIRAGLAHLYFVTIHPYDDGNGRIARALSVKAISEGNGEPTLISLSHAISDDKNAYYKALQAASRHNDINAWLEYFCDAAIRAQEITKDKLYQTAVIRTINNAHGDTLNECQKNAIEGLVSGTGTKKQGILSVAEYIEINKTQMRERAKAENKPFKDIARQDIAQLVKLKILKKSTKSEGERFLVIYPKTPGISEFRQNAAEKTTQTRTATKERQLAI